MRTALAAFLLWALAANSATAADMEDGGITPGLRSGLLFQPRGRLTLATGTWTAVVRFRQGEVQRQADDIRMQFDHIDRVLEDTSEAEGNVNQTTEEIRGKQFITEVKRMWEQEKAWMEAEIRAGEAEIHELRTELIMSRRTRGLINALGDGLKWLFGTATEEDTKKLHKNIKGLEVGLGKLHHIAELQTTVIGSLSKDQRRNTRNLAILAKQARDMELDLAKTRTADHLTMRNIRREMDFGRTVSSAIRTASAAVMTFHHEVKQIARAMTHTQQGIVTPTIIPPATLKTTLTAITNHLPDGWTPAVPLSETPANMYKFFDISAVALVDGWEVHIRIPLQYRPYSRFHLYEVTSVPTHFPNSSVALETQIPAKFFAISRDQRLHLEANDEDLQRCRQTGRYTLCHELTPLIREKREGCMYHAFRDDQEKATQECKRVLVQPTPQLYSVAKDKWLYVLPKEESFSMQCAEESQPTRGFRLQGTGVFSLPSGCAAMGDHYIVPAHLRRQTKEPEEITLQDMTHFKFQLDPMVFEAHAPGGNALNQTQLEEIMKAPTGIAGNPTLTELQEKVKTWVKPTETDEIPTELLKHTSLSLGAVSAIGVIILGIVVCVKTRRTPERATPIPTSSPMHVPSAPLLPEHEYSLKFEARLIRLETITDELQRKLERVAQHEVVLEKLKKKCEQLTAFL